MRTQDLFGINGHTSISGQGIARFWKLRGRRVIEAGGVFWGYHGQGLYECLPYHLELAPDAGDLDQLLKETRMFVVRYPSTLRGGLTCDFYVCEPKGYGLQTVHRKERGKIREGLEHCEIRPVSAAELLHEGLELNRDTLQRQGRWDAEFGDFDLWQRLVNAVAGCPEMEVTGAYVHGRLAAYVIACREDGWLHLLYKHSRTSERSLCINHALDYSILEAAGRDPGIRAVGNYYASFMATPGLDQYKRHMGFRLVPRTLCTHIHPLLAPLLVSRVALRGVRALQALRPADSRWAAAARLLEGAWHSRNGTAGVVPETA